MKIKFYFVKTRLKIYKNYPEKTKELIKAINRKLAK